MTSLAQGNSAAKPVSHGIIKDISALGNDKVEKWSRSDKGLKIVLCDAKGENDVDPLVFKITVD